ncbi:MAG TPA: hypothetical protein VIW45_16020, partial [Vicinamibacterales bacterium]
MQYCVYGLRVASDMPLAAAALVDGGSADVSFAIDQSRCSTPDGPRPFENSWYRSEWTDDATGAPGLRIYRSRSNGAFRIRYSDGVDFQIDADGRHIVARAPSDASLNDVACYLTGPVLGFVLRQRGIVALHASAIEIGGRAFLFVGDARSGKSTTAAVLARMGHKVITEDIAALEVDEDAVRVRPGCMEIALRPDTVAAMYGSPEALPRFSDTWEKRRLDLTEAGTLASASATIGGVYMLTNSAGTRDAPYIEPMSSGEAMAELLANVYGNRLFHEALRLRELDVVHRVAGTVPVK